MAAAQHRRTRQAEAVAPPRVSAAAAEGAAPQIDSARQRILDAARIHFAEHGLQQASVRRITELAGANVALISYHFGSKQQLFDAVLADCVVRLNRPRIEKLDAMEAEAGGAPLRVPALLDVYVSPYLDAALDRSRDASIYARFYGRLFTEPTPDLQQSMRLSFAPLHARFVAALERALPHVRRQDLFVRFASLNGAMIGLFSGTGSLEQISGGLCATRPARAFWDHFVAVWSDMMQAPSRPLDAEGDG
jgi:AcrR family transcriptional regulator